MTPASRILGVSFAIALAVVTACDKSPTRPAPGPQPGAAVTMSRLEVAGPSAVQPGETAQFLATAHFSDGTNRDVTGEAAWHSSNTSVLTLSGGGVATARDRGEAEVRVIFAGLLRTLQVLVLPTGTFRLAGRVTEAGVATEFVRDARVEATAGSGPAVFTMTDNNGRYRLYGVSADPEIRVTREGYEPHVQRLLMAEHATLDVELKLTRPRENLSGVYTLTLTAAPDCSSALPDEARTRTYTATVTQTASRLSVTLGGATFFTGFGQRANTFVGTTDVERVTFSLFSHYDDGWYYYYPSVIEQIAPQLFLVPAGSVMGTISTSGISGRLDGVIELREATGSRLAAVATCRSSDHRFVLVR
jgi:hypothetical protein